jgi:hypothetical protein
MTNSKRIAGLVGPTIVAMVVSEFPLVQPHLYDAQIPPVVYLSGVLMFVGGLAIVRAHNHWMPDWTVLITLSGWFFRVVSKSAWERYRVCAQPSRARWLAVLGAAGAA